MSAPVKGFVRERLIDRIRRASHYRVTLVAASAGFGKSTLVKQFLHLDQIAHVRFDVRAEHAGLPAFVRGFTEALAPVAPHLGGSFATAYESARQATDPSLFLAEWLHENIKSVPITIVVDDLHNVEGHDDIVNLIVQLIERSTTAQPWILSTRTPMGLPVEAWWGRGSMALPIEEADLQLSDDEARSVARERDPEIAEETVKQLTALTAGWPLAFMLALSIDGALEGTSALAMQGRTREIVYRSLAKRAFAQASQRAQAFMLATCKLPVIDLGGLGYLETGADAGTVEEIYEAGSFLERVSETRYRYIDLFREFLERELEAHGGDSVRGAILRAARVLARTKDLTGAIRLYIEAAAPQDVFALLESQGLDLIEGGNAEAVNLALAFLTGEEFSGDAVVLGLHAMIESQRGRYDISDAWFRTAIDRAQPALRVDLTARYSEAILHRFRADCIAVLEPLVDDPNLQPDQAVRIYSTLSTAYVIGQRFDDARVLMHRALDLSAGIKSLKVNALVSQQAAWISLYTGDIKSARKYGQSAVELATELGLYGVAARAHSVLFVIASDIEDDVASAMEQLRRIADCGLKSGDHNLRLYAAAGMYEVEAGRGDGAAMEQLERSLASFEFSFGDRVSLDTLVPAKALHFAGNGNFEQALALVADSAERLFTDDRKAYRWSEIALYAAATENRRDEAIAAMHAADELPAELDPSSRRTIRTKVNFALANLLLGRETELRALVSDLNTLAPRGSQNIRALIGAVLSIIHYWQGEPNYEDVIDAFAELRRRQMGGLAALLEALPRYATTVAGQKGA